MEKKILFPQMQFCNLATLLLGLLLLASPLTAWSALETSVTGPVISEQQAIGLALNRIKTGKQAITVTNRRHSALFDRRGVQFTPRRGPEWHWRLTHINDAQQEEVTPTRGAADAVDFNRGGLIERYLIKAATIEQRFVIERPWPQDADLVITGAIDSAGKMETTDQGWVWRDKSGVVTLGQVTVFDATGKIIPAQMQVTEARSIIQVAAADLAGAVYPVTVDPEIGTNDFRISDMGADGVVTIGASDPAVAYNNAGDEYLVVWSGDEADDEFEIYAQLVAADGTEIGADFRVSDMGADGVVTIGAFTPAVAYNAAAGEYLVVWAGDDVDDEFEIYAQRIDVGGTELGTDFRVSDMGADGVVTIGAFTPSVAYNTTDTSYLVVWAGDDVDDEFEIYAQRIDIDGTEIGTDFRISDMGADGVVTIGAADPAVTYNDTDNEYLVVWAGDDVDDEFEIYAQRIAFDGTELGTDFRISDMGADGVVTIGAAAPSAAYNATDDEYLVVWSGDDVDDEFEIYAQRITFDGTEVGTDFRISDMGADGVVTIGAFTPAVAYNTAKDEYLVAWAGDDVDDEFEIYGQRIASDGTEVDTDFRLSDMGADGVVTIGASAPAMVYNTSNEEYMVVWSGDDVDDEFEIYGQLYELIVTGGGGLTGFVRDHEGHCSLGRKDAALDPTLWLLMLVAGAYLLRRRCMRASADSTG